MYDKHQRKINYLRISLTDRCNLRCVYCMPSGGVNLLPHDDILRLEEISYLVKIAIGLGFDKVRLTGGEPLVRRGIIPFVQSLTILPGLKDVSLTTNGVLLSKYAEKLYEAGLKRVNISLDTLKPERFRRITRVDKWKEVWAGIETALAAGMEPIKLNVVILRGINDDEIWDLAALSLKYPLHVRFIELMPIGECSKWSAASFVSYRETKKTIEKKAPLEPAPEVKGGGPACYYCLPGGKGTVGFITAISEHFCAQCNRIRLTAEGKLRPCLQGKDELDIKSALRQGASREELEQIMIEAIKRKPVKHTMVEEGWENQRRSMYEIGG